jgi:hypothetical protein
MSARWADLIDELDKFRVGRRLVEIVAARWLLSATTADTAESGDRLCAICVYVLVLAMLAHPGDYDVIFVSEHEMHAPVSIEAPLADTVVRARLGSHADTAGLAATLPKLIDYMIELLLRFAAEPLYAGLTTPSDTNAEPRCHSNAGSRSALRSEIHRVAGQGVFQTLTRTGLSERSLIGRFAQ